MYIQSCTLRLIIPPSCQLLSFNILEYRFSNYIFANHVQELWLLVPELDMPVNYKFTSHTNHGVIYCKELSTKTRRWNIGYRSLIALVESIRKLALVTHAQ